MKKKALAWLLSWAALTCSAQTKIILDPDLTNTRISKHIYGHFAEHLGRSIYGGVYVGENNTLIPHTAGIRNDIVAALKELKVPNLRWPGGCFADAYQWKDGIGSKKDRPSMINAWWGGTKEDNSFGTHDFLDLCERIGAEPYLAGNVGSGTVKDLSDWVSYVNHPGGSPMAVLRQQNGREKPWNVKMWGVGNEAWGCGGNMTAEYYANIYRQYATFMNDWSKDAKLFRVASGANDGDYHWTETLMKNIPLTMLSGVALHHYSVLDWKDKGPSVAFSEAQYFKTMQEAWKMEEFVTRHSTIMDKYDPDKKVALLVDEWGGWYNVEEGTNPGFLYQQNTMRDAMIAGLTLNIFNNHADRVRGANLAQMVNVLQAVILTKDEKMLLTPTYHVMKMYNVHQDAMLVPVQIQAPDYQFGEEKLPAVSASCSRDSSGKLNISLTNIDYSRSNEVTIQLRGEAYSRVSGQILSSAKMSDHNTFEQPNKIAVADFSNARLEKQVLKLTIPAHSVIVLKVEK
ncbi:alpha-N-arabinofuranosidase [Dyadobacter flavalbus]|uniref:non-reducing end alpha-L-arabinofuranosidase n=1 Tax=Dyadobacter flavalbus TaxID=2579942 RepID=A0A5M8QRW7_9BACT|nr:alpha-L-arabinofuranosidase C-terminal domain-containing protein [Dyadobacter flavalbus]KAA6439007.1 alpha-N-arabinofuranosidase [Dyadobacter flavalbus]